MKIILTIAIVLFSLIAQAQCEGDTTIVPPTDTTIVPLPIKEKPPRKPRRNLEKQSVIAVYPNPASTLINVTLAKPSRVLVTNALEQKLFSTQGIKRVQIPVTFPAGIYYVHIIEADRKEVKKVVIINR